MRNQQVVVVLQERGKEGSERTGERERERGRERERAAQPAESRLPLKGKYPHSQHNASQ